MGEIDMKKLVKKNIVWVTCTALVVGIHWGWSKMQQNPNLVDPRYRRDLPIYTMYQDLKFKLTGAQSIDVPEDKETLKD